MDIPSLPPLGIDLPQQFVQVEVVGKPWYKSKTVWFNVAAGAVEALQLVGTLGVLPPGTITTATAAVNIVLRRITKTPIQTGKPLMTTGILRPTPDALLEAPPGGLPPWMNTKG